MPQRKRRQAGCVARCAPTTEQSPVRSSAPRSACRFFGSASGLPGLSRDGRAGAAHERCSGDPRDLRRMSRAFRSNASGGDVAVYDVSRTARARCVTQRQRCGSVASTCMARHARFHIEPRRSCREARRDLRDVSRARELRPLSRERVDIAGDRRARQRRSRRAAGAARRRGLPRSGHASSR